MNSMRVIPSFKFFAFYVFLLFYLALVTQSKDTWCVCLFHTFDGSAFQVLLYYKRFFLTSRKPISIFFVKASSFSLNVALRGFATQ